MSVFTSFSQKISNTKKGMNSSFTHLRLMDREISISDINAAVLKAAVDHQLSFRENGDSILEHSLMDIAALALTMAEQQKENRDKNIHLQIDYEHKCAGEAYAIKQEKLPTLTAETALKLRHDDVVYVKSLKRDCAVNEVVQDSITKAVRITFKNGSACCPEDIHAVVK